MILLSTFQHSFAIAARDLIKTAHFVETKVLPALKTAKADESMIESVTALINPNAVNVERVAFAVLGLVIQAVEDAQNLAAGQTLNIGLDLELVNDIKAIIPAVKAHVAPTASAAIAKV